MNVRDGGLKAAVAFFTPRMARGSAQIPVRLREHYSLDAETDPSIAVQLYGMLDREVSLANVALAISRALTAALPDVGLHSYTGCRFLDPSLRWFAGRNPDAPVAVFAGMPSQVHHAMDGHAVKIGVFVCETDRIPQDWVEACNRLDLVVVPSRFSGSAFAESGVVVPIMLVHHGLEPDYVPVPGLRPPDRFVFYETLTQASFGPRKGYAELIRCFVRAFEGRDGVRLRLRAPAARDISDLLRECSADDLVDLDLFSWTPTAEFARLFSEVHCTVHPCRGEGFGLIPFQSIACETPVIAPAVTGLSEYLNADNALLLEPGPPVAGRGHDHPGHYYSVNEDDLVDKLRHMHAHWDQELHKVQAIGAGFREQWSWQRVLAPFVDLVRALNDRPRAATAHEFLAANPACRLQGPDGVARG